ncbi:type II toxin-antitoxin system VapC family toxin [Candidatus Entotheonella palauensis]|uniref:Twitching motility protein PilT n=1 Tax=Candidatus Entotheonella gemina TaxID=1429439 RepID=W4M7Q6_9BACT|nr:type II toxin-antitoxin system VapC family toxin [Candidatus Entotheonella palauensis]ETX05951.1 MAG: twitching motility protein PilT [Candidatus Entotheonella gemina]
MNIVIDTSAVIAVIVNEPHRQRLIEVTTDEDILAPHSLHWEIGNAFTSMFKQSNNNITLEQAQEALTLYERIPIRFVDVPLQEALTLAHQLDIYAYDAYMLVCAQHYHGHLLSLDRRLLRAAGQLNLPVIEVAP